MVSLLLYTAYDKRAFILADARSPDFATNINLRESLVVTAENSPR
jgi:hypothetical protein